MLWEGNLFFFFCSERRHSLSQLCHENNALKLKLRLKNRTTVTKIQNNKDRVAVWKKMLKNVDENAKSVKSNGFFLKVSELMFVLKNTFFWKRA